MGVKSTTELTRKEAVDWIIRNIVEERTKYLKEFWEKELKRFPNEMLEDMLEKQEEEKGHMFDNFLIVKKDD